MAAAIEPDRFGIGWRAELAVEIQGHLDRFDVIEVIAESWLDASRARLEALRWLGRAVPLVVHATSLGLASSEPVDEFRLARVADFVARVGAADWSEHLAFVRGGGVEIGHLAAPPRTRATAIGTRRNVERAARVVGRAPLVENVATVIDPPASRMSEAAWITACIEDASCDMLLDLHNLHANATNFGFDPRAFLDTILFERVAEVHLAGGRWIGPEDDRRLFDDHLHDVPDPVFELLAEVGERARRPITVILERDGSFGPFAGLLEQLDRARRALAAGRSRARAGGVRA